MACSSRAFEHPRRLCVVSARDPASAAPVREQAFNIQRWTEMPRGGHFAALEVPGLLAEDVAAFFRVLRGR